MNENDINLKSAIEAIIFAAGYPVSFIKLSETLGVCKDEITRLTAEIAAGYEAREHGIKMIIFDGSCQLCTKEIHIDKIREVLGVKRGGNLSRSSLETLAIIAYHQPVTKSYIEQIRGIDSAYSVNNLTEKKLIEVCGRLDAPGKPALYRTTDNFLRVFGLAALSELPPIELFGEPTVEGGE